MKLVQLVPPDTSTTSCFAGDVVYYSSRGLLYKMRIDHHVPVLVYDYTRHGNIVTIEVRSDRLYIVALHLDCYGLFDERGRLLLPTMSVYQFAETCIYYRNDQGDVFRYDFIEHVFLHLELEADYQASFCGATDEAVLLGGELLNKHSVTEPCDSLWLFRDGSHLLENKLMKDGICLRTYKDKLLFSDRELHLRGTELVITEWDDNCDVEENDVWQLEGGDLHDSHRIWIDMHRQNGLCLEIDDDARWIFWLVFLCQPGHREVANKLLPRECAVHIHSFL